jgi:NAD(P)H-hydrate epimerase
MFEVLTADEMKKADAAAIAAGIPGITLMQQAGSAVATIVKEHIEPCPVLVLCGPGNNGGDGFIAAARLKKAGWNVRLACLAKKSALKGDAALAAKEWEDETESLNSNLGIKDAGLVIDAVFGTGFSGELAPELVTLFDKVRAKKARVVAVDVPSGMNATTGQTSQGALKADITVTFCRKKLAHLLLPSKSFCGRLHIGLIGIEDRLVAELKTNVFENNPGLWIKDFPIPVAESHKYSRGHALVFGGPVKTGAACLAAFAAQRAGAGAVTITSAPESASVYRHYRASVMVDEWRSPEEFKSLLRDERRTAILLGPGAGLDDNFREIVEAALSFNKFAVLDADVFTVFKNNPKDLFAKLSPAKHVLTPHEGEFERLFGTLEGNKLERARKAAKTANAVVLLKGSDTVVAAPDGTAVINSNAPSTLATAGSGDVLAGLIAGLMAQGMHPFMASVAGVWLHAESARNYGLGLTAEDIIMQLPQVLNRLFNLQ